MDTNGHEFEGRKRNKLAQEVTERTEEKQKPFPPIFIRELTPIHTNVDVGRLRFNGRERRKFNPDCLCQQAMGHNAVWPQMPH
jgi:hypothetical protein